MFSFGETVYSVIPLHYRDPTRPQCQFSMHVARPWWRLSQPVNATPRPPIVAATLPPQTSTAVSNRRPTASEEMLCGACRPGPQGRIARTLIGPPRRLLNRGVDPNATYYFPFVATSGALMSGSFFPSGGLAGAEGQIAMRF
jgi:hypothetical protein